MINGMGRDRVQRMRLLPRHTSLVATTEAIEGEAPQVWNVWNQYHMTAGYLINCQPNHFPNVFIARG